MRRCIENERYFRKIKSDPAATFLDWENDNFTKTGTSIITVRGRRACKALGVGLKLEGSLLLIKVNGSEKKTGAAIEIGYYLTEKVVRPQKIEKLLSKEKHGSTFAILEKNLVPNKLLTEAKTTRSDAFFRFPVAARADVLPTLANIQQWYRRPGTMCQRCDKYTEST
jgi:hypothetical protein